MPVPFSSKVKKANESGLSWIVSWVLYGLLHCFPGIYIRKWSRHVKKPGIIEIYVLLKTSIAFLFFFFCLYRYPAAQIVLIVFLIETILYNLFFIVCSNLHDQPISAKRSLILGFINYIEIVFTFASIYSFTGTVQSSVEAAVKLTKVDYIYFSIATGGVLGFGDYRLVNDDGKIIAILQCLVFIMFFILFITYNLTLFTNQQQATAGTPE